MDDEEDDEDYYGDDGCRDRDDVLVVRWLLGHLGGWGGEGGRGWCCGTSRRKQTGEERGERKEERGGNGLERTNSLGVE